MRAWEEFLSQQEVFFGHEVVTRWLQPIRILRYDAGNLYLEAQDTFQALWFEEHIRPKLKSFVNINNRLVKVHLSIANHKPIKSEATGRKKTHHHEEVPRRFELQFDPLDPYCTFKNFIVSEHNEIPYQLLCELSGADGSSPKLGELNPFYLYGKEGSGRSHLMMAAAQSLREHGYHALYVRAETFTSHVVGAIRSGEMSFFRQTYRNSDILLIDDIDLFSNKGATQEELFHTFNTLHLAGKQIILAALTPPHVLAHIEPRLISRFEWGIVLPLVVPDAATTEKILSVKEKNLNFPLNNKIKHFLLENFASSPRALSRALEALVLRSHLHHTSIPSTQMSLTAAKHFLTDLIAEEEANTITAAHILEGVANYFGITREDLVGKSQKRDCALPRQIAMYFCRSRLKLPYQKIGDLMERDHSTVMSSIKRIQEMEEAQDQEVVTAIATITEQME